MSNQTKARFAVDLDDLERQLRVTAGAQPKTQSSDPLAELARIVGQDDPFKAMFADKHAPAPAGSAPSVPAPPVYAPAGAPLTGGRIEPSLDALLRDLDARSAPRPAAAAPMAAATVTPVASSATPSQDMLDEFGFSSHQKAIAATQSGAFGDEIVAVEITLADGTREIHTIDEGIRFEASLEGIKGVKLLVEGGAVTAATSSQICDGASGVMVVNERGLKALGVEPLARIHHMTVTGGDPVVMLEEPVFATQKALKRAGMSINEIDLYEVNEAFAPVPLAWLQGNDADPSKLNVNGGAIALGHPLGGSGTKLMSTLVHALRKNGKRYGLQTMCEGGGLANVTIVEAL